jgi:signal transduction histidine kinase
LKDIVELKQRMLFLEQAYASGRMGHFVLDPKRRTVEFSTWARDNIGFNDMPIPVDRLPEIVPEDERETFRSKVEEVIAAEDEFEFETNVITAKGQIRIQRISGIPAYANQYQREGLIGYFGIVQEITNQRETERSLREARDKAQAQLSARANILATVSHEIRTPLSGILGVIDQLKRERSPAERDRAVALIEDSCEVLLDTLDAILQQARIDQDAENFTSRPFSPRALVHRVAELFRPLARRKGLSIEVDAKSQAEALGDPARIQQVLANFVSNAVKFTQTGSITITAEEPVSGAGEWTFVVSDTGSGMDEKRLESIFDAFGKSSDDTFGKAVGTGLGLSITRDLVKAMGGTIDVQSEIGNGSTFSVTLPLETPTASKEDTKDELRGTAFLAIEKASDRIQVEAAVAAASFAMREMGEADVPVESLAVCIVDNSQFADVAPKLPAAVERIFVIGDGDVPSGLNEHIDVIFLPQAGFSRDLSHLLRGDIT